MRGMGRTGRLSNPAFLHIYVGQKMMRVTVEGPGIRSLFEALKQEYMPGLSGSKKSKPSVLGRIML